MAEATEEERYKSDSYCLILKADGGEERDVVERVLFKRDEAGEASIDDSAADVLGLPRGERVRCFQVPHIEKKLGYVLHAYIDLQGLEHNLPHNTNATQLWLVANLPEEPPSVSPSSIHGPVLLSATDFKTEEYRDMSLDDWRLLKDYCRAIQPNAQFLPYEQAPEPAAAADEEDDE